MPRKSHTAPPQSRTPLRAVPELPAASRSIELPTGRVGPRELGVPPGGSALLLVCDGLLLAHVELCGTRATDVLGPGDLVRLGTGAHDLLRPGWGLQIDERARVAVLDGQLHEIVRRSPDVAERLVQSAGDRSRRQLLHRVAVQRPRVEARLMGVLWLLAERWGTLTPAGVALPFRLTHALLGQLVGAKRPTVTTAVSALIDAGDLVRCEHGVLLVPASRRHATAADGLPLSA